MIFVPLPRFVFPTLRLFAEAKLTSINASQRSIALRALPTSDWALVLQRRLVVVALGAGDGFVDVVELHSAWSKVGVASGVSDKMNGRRRQIHGRIGVESIRQRDGETEAACNRAINFLVAPCTDGILFATAARLASAGAIAMDAAIRGRLAELWPVIFKDRSFVFQIDHDGQHSTGGIVALGDPVARGALIESIRLGGDIDHARDGAGQRI
jgi:hypothetical protein